MTMQPKLLHPTGALLLEDLEPRDLLLDFVMDARTPVGAATGSRRRPCRTEGSGRLTGQKRFFQPLPRCTVKPP